jgi:hypothetical protein
LVSEKRSIAAGRSFYGVSQCHSRVGLWILTAVQPENAEYWQLTEQVIDLARTIILTPDAIPTAQVDAFIDYRTGLLIRVTNNLATAAYSQISDQSGFNLNDNTKITEVLYPLPVFTIVPALLVVTEDIERGIAYGLRSRRERTALTTDDAVVPPYIEGSVSPSGTVLNGAMPVIVKLLNESVALIGESNAENLEASIGYIRSQLRTSLRN